MRNMNGQRLLEKVTLTFNNLVKHKSQASAKASVFDQNERVELVECVHCNRKFSEASIEKHQDICQKLNSKPKRSVFGVKRI